MTPLLLMSYIAGAGAMADTFRRPFSAWEHADRDRGHWVMVGVFTTLLGLGLLFGLLYLALVVPRFGSTSETQGDFKRHDFRR